MSYGSVVAPHNFPLQLKDLSGQYISIHDVLLTLRRKIQIFCYLLSLFFFFIKALLKRHEAFESDLEAHKSRLDQLNNIITELEYVSSKGQLFICHL